MRIRKYDFNWGQRELLKKSAIGASAGLLAPVSKLMAEGKDLSKAYPDELISIDEYTKGKISVGDTISADNVEHVKDLLDPMTLHEVKKMGRKIKIKPTTTDPEKLFPKNYLARTRNNKKTGHIAGFDKTGNVIDTKDGGHWIGGLPFPDAKTGIEAQANMAMSWGRNDYCQYAIAERDVGPDGKPSYQYDFVWAELQVSARVDGKVFQNKKDLLRYQTVAFTNTQDVAGTSFLSTWYYDQRKFPQLMGYLPQFRRSRTFPASQRFEPLIPGVTWFLSDPWAAGDPMLTWGDYKILKRAPSLGSFNTYWRGNRDNWVPPIHGGKAGQTFFDTYFEMAPEVLTLQSKPTKYPRAPVGFRRAWVDTRNYIYCGDIRYDRNGKLWCNFETGFGQYDTPDGKKQLKDANGNPVWSWMYVMAYDIQQNRMSRAAHNEHTYGGYHNVYNANNQEMYEKWFTQQAIQRLGAV